MIENFIAHAILTIVMLVGPEVKPGGDSIYGPNARHNLFRIIIKAPDHPSMAGQYWPGVLKQELAEWRGLWLFSLLLTAYPAWIASEWYFAFPIGLVGTLISWTIIKLLTSGLDVLGTNVEIIAAERAGLVGYRDQEAERYAGKGSLDDAKRSLKLFLPLAYVIYPLGYRVGFMERGIGAADPS